MHFSRLEVCRTLDAGIRLEETIGLNRRKKAESPCLGPASRRIAKHTALSRHSIAGTTRALACSCGSAGQELGRSRALPLTDQNTGSMTQQSPWVLRGRGTAQKPTPTSQPGWQRLALPGGFQGLPLTYYDSARVVALQHQVVRPALGRPNLDCDPKAAPALQGSTSRDLHRACKEVSAAGMLGSIVASGCGLLLHCQYLPTDGPCCPALELCGHGGWLIAPANGVA